MASNGILLLTRPLSALQRCIASIIEVSAQSVQRTLYVHIHPDADFTRHGYQKIIPTSTTNKFILQLYAGAANMCSTLDVRVLLGNMASTPGSGKTSQTLSKSVDLVLIDQPVGSVAKEDILSYLSNHFNIKPELPLKVVYDDSKVDETNQSNKAVIDDTPVKQYKHVCLGGTFDRIHTGHKILLTEACIRCNNKLTIGVTDVPMIQSKTLCELIEPTEKRLVNVRSLVEDISPDIECEAVPIVDPYGPSIVYPDIECLVVSQETLRGGESVNRKRLEKGLSETLLHVIDLVEDTCRTASEEEKISSSSQRRRLLGTLLKPPNELSLSKGEPYIIGLTGGIASGKSSIRERLEKLGAGTIDCDKIAHLAYEPGRKAFDDLIEAFSSEILDQHGRIDRKKLGAQVFGNEDKRQLLNSIVWPAVEQLAWEEVKKLAQQGKTVVVLEAALLLDAGWGDKLNEVWVTVVPPKEALKRTMERNNLSEEAASLRIESQPSNMSRVKEAHVLLSTLWAYEETQAQVEKAWRLLKERIQS